MKKSLYVFIALFATMPMAIMGAIFGYMGETSNVLSGFLWGLGTAITLGIVLTIGYVVWGRLKDEARDGRLWPYIIGGIIAAVAISSLFAFTLGDPSCIESTDPDGRLTACLEYADDGFEATAEQRWEEFWGKLPVVALICLLIAYIAHVQVEKSQPKYFKSEEDGFSISIFPEDIVAEDNDGIKTYHYKMLDSIRYYVSVIPLENKSRSKQEKIKAIKSWQSEMINVRAEKLPEPSSGTRQNVPFVYQAYENKDGTTYRSYAYLKDNKIYDLYMFTSRGKGYNGNSVFFEFVDSFRFIKK